MWFTFNFRACFFSSCLSSAGVTPICRTESEYWSPWRPRRHRRPAHWACRPWRTQRPVCPTRPPGWDWDRPGRQRRMNETMTKDPRPLLTGREYLFFLYFSSFFFTLMQLEKSHDTEGNYKMCFYGEVGLNGVQRQTAQQIHLLWKANKTFVSLFKIEFSVNIWIWHE